MQNNKLMKLAVMANSLSAQAAALASTILAFIEEQNVAAGGRKNAIKLIKKMQAKPKVKRAKRVAKRTKKVAEEQPKVEEKK